MRRVGESMWKVGAWRARWHQGHQSPDTLLFYVAPGIRHRRRTLGLQLHGRPEALVLSVFEREPSTANGTQQFTSGIRVNRLSNDPAEARPFAHPGQPCKPPYCSMGFFLSPPELDRARQHALRELPHHNGINSPGYHVAASHFSLEALQRASKSLHGKLSCASTSRRVTASGEQEERRRETDSMGYMRASPPLTSGQASIATKRSLDLDPAELACLSFLTPRDHFLKSLCLKGTVCNSGIVDRRIAHAHWPAPSGSCLPHTSISPPLVV